jgi:alpha-L-rhamnosidase
MLFNMINKKNSVKFLLMILGCIMVNSSLAVRAAMLDKSLLWISSDKAPANTHVAFRGKFNLAEAGEVELQVSGASWYVIWIDGEYFCEGPDRYVPAYPEYQSKKTSLAGGDHLIAIQVHYEGIETRILDDIQPFILCNLQKAQTRIPFTWKCKQLEGFEKTGFRINAELGWVEWADTQRLPGNWQKPEFNDTEWTIPVAVDRGLGEFRKSGIGNVRSLEVIPKLMAEGKLAEIYGYEKDNPSARFFLRDLTCNKLPPQGVWKRYDLGRVRLARPKFILDLPEGGVVEFAYCESLQHGRVTPWITLSASDSYNLDHFVAKGGIQEFFPMHPKGGRFVEVHVLAPVEKIRFVQEKFLERSYYDQPEGDFRCNDELLNTIWKTGIETYKACSEDALIDNPTRERGQWIGDMGVGGMQIGSAGFSDIRICRRGLAQSAQCARDDGMVAGLCPGGEGYLSSFSAQWVPACLNYYRLTGDKTLLEELYHAAEKNIAAFQRYMNDWGISYDAGWAFIDWGYVPNPEPADMGLNLHYYIALQNMIKWSAILNKSERIKEYKKLEAQISEIIQKWFLQHVENGRYRWETIGYHRIVLGMLAGFIPQDQQKEAVAFIKKHILNCYPNNPDAPRLSDPGANNPQLITPYFSHFAFQVLIEQGEMEFVLDQYRKCWGWALEDGRTTWVEVFDTRWSHCHQWAGSPTWQISRYVLGLHPQFDQGPNRFKLNLHTGDLTFAEGRIPLPDGKTIQVQWQKIRNTIRYEVIVPEPIAVEIPHNLKASKKGIVVVKDKMTITIPY